MKVIIVILLSLIVLQAKAQIISEIATKDWVLIKLDPRIGDIPMKLFEIYEGNKTYLRSSNDMIFEGNVIKDDNNRSLVIKIMGNSNQSGTIDNLDVYIYYFDTKKEVLIINNKDFYLPTRVLKYYNQLRLRALQLQKNAR